MKLILSSATWLDSSALSTDYFSDILWKIEVAGRTCYKSEDKITPDSAEKFCQMLIKRGHESVLEHASLSLRIICDRGVSHELVRHRLASYSQESTRYVNYSKKGMEFIIPSWLEGKIKPKEYNSTESESDFYYSNSHDSRLQIWFRSMVQAEKNYNALISEGWTPQQARSVLPNSLKTEIVVTANIRQWRTILKQRTSSNAHPDMRNIMVKILALFQYNMPVLFNDIKS